MRELHSLSDSQIYDRIKDPSLKAIVEKAAIESAQLLGTVVIDMPLFTFHNERHVLNVIGWMETLLGEDGIPKLGQLECALCILAAYAHDLGMTLDHAESNALSTDAGYLRHRDRFPEELRLIANLQTGGQHQQAFLIEGFLRTDYLRATHADAPSTRLCARLKQVAPKLEYNGVDFRSRLELIAISHNQNVEWLRLQFERKGIPWHTVARTGEPVNYAFIGLLLRLADIMDFDASRTPSILFHHLGLENDLAASFQKTSGDEWRKHLAITAIDEAPNLKKLTWVAESCPSPVVEKSIRHFVNVIGQEIKQVASELNHVVEAVPGDRTRLLIRLPEVDKRITQALDDSGRPLYEYHDWQFTLDQEEIMRLLMGESLYGDPSLCIRELLQNSLDALELRDLRLQLSDKEGARLAEPVDGDSVKPGWFKDKGKTEELAVSLTWGEKNGQQFIRVEDNGVGMTIETISRYFTQIGKSFYKSPDFKSEQADMRRNGLISTPISTFGIGVLSCFMIADRLQVRTHPGSVSASRAPHDLEISGPGSLFWTRPGTRDRQGTEITLWLRADKPLMLPHNRDLCFERLRKRFNYYPNVKAEKEREDPPFDPGFIAASHVVWPRYPVHIGPPAQAGWTIDDRFHLEHLAPIDSVALSQKLREWDYPADAAGSPSWNPIDWTDSQGEHATGTRLRIWYAAARNSSLQLWELLTLVHPQIQSFEPLCLSQSMNVADAKSLLSIVACAPGLGCRIWLDLRGSASPQLTANRYKAIAPSDGHQWRGIIAAMWDRCMEAQQSVEIREPLRWQQWTRELRPRIRAEIPDYFDGGSLPSRETRLLAAQSLSMDLARAIGLNFAREFYLGSAANNLDRDLVLARDLGAFAAQALTLNREHPVDLPAAALARGPALDVAAEIELAVNFANALATFADNALARARNPLRPGTYEEALQQTNFLQEGFFPDLASSFPPSQLQALDGIVGNAVLTAPAHFRCEVDSRRVLFADQSSALPTQLATQGYDLCFPMTAIPIGPLRRDFPAWREDRRYRPLGVLPFLILELSDLWRNHAEVLLQLFYPIRQIHAFQPAEDLWSKPFSDWTPTDWNHPDHRSVLWDIATGIVHRADGVHHRDAMPKLTGDAAAVATSPIGSA